MNRLEREKKQEEQLKTELLRVIEDAVVGERFDSALVGRVKTLVRSVLLQAKQSQAQIHVGLVDAGLEVQIVLPPKGPRVGVIKLSFGGDGSFLGI